MKVTEADPGGGIHYLLHDDAGELLRSVKPSCSHVVVEEIDVYIVYDSTLRPVYEMSRFLTQARSLLADNTISQTFAALKLLRSYEEITGRPFEDFDETTARSFLAFLRGTPRSSLGISYSGLTCRSESTIRPYMSVYRAFAKFLKLESSPFLERASSHTAGPDGFPRRYEMTIGDAPELIAPTFVTIDEFLALVKELEDTYDGAAVVIVRLMFEHGLRIGEALGLTIEDIGTAKVKGRLRHYVDLRERASDSPDRHAKTAMKVKSADAYRKADYAKRDVGYQRVFISDDLFGALAAYAERAHGLAKGGFEDRRRLTAAADSVAGGEENHYVFLNSIGSVLRQDTWNRQLRKAFAKVGIPLDEGVRSDNLNHRLRHGYAHVLTHKLGCNDYTVMTLMRHKSLKSTAVYGNPTAEEVAELQLEVVDQWAEAILP